MAQNDDLGEVGARPMSAAQPRCVLVGKDVYLIPAGFEVVSHENPVVVSDGCGLLSLRPVGKMRPGPV